MSDKAKPRPLSRKQKIFIDEYLICFNASEAARRAGYRGRPDTIGSRLLGIVGIKALVDARVAESHMSADEALKLLAEQARGKKPTKKVESSSVEGTVVTETYDQLEALDKVLKTHGKYKSNVDLTSAGKALTWKEFINAASHPIPDNE